MDSPKKTATYPPGLEPYPLIGHMPQLLANRHRVLDWMTDALALQPTSTFVVHRPGGLRGAITANPANVEHILRSSFDNYPKGPRVVSMMHNFLGGGIFNADGESWREQRKVASHEFNTRSLRAFVARCVHDELHGRLLPLLRRATASGSCLDLQDVLERFGFDNICRVAFDHDPRQLSVEGDGDDAGTAANAGSSSFADAFRDASYLSVGRFRYAIPGFWKVKKALNVGSERRLRESVATVHGFADRIIQSRREEMLRRDGFEFEKHDLLSRFMASQGAESYDTESNKEALRDVVTSFLLAGRESTSSALTWFFWLLSSRPDVQRRIRDEIAAVRARHPRGDDALGFDLDELREMHYLHAAITESMRQYPPVPANSLHVQADDVLPDGTAVKAGWSVGYNSYAMGRMVSVWGDDALEYRPERWLSPDDGTFQPGSPFRFVAFHAGPRLCLGKEMAYIQMKSVVASVLEELDVVVDGAYRPRQLPSLTLRMAGGLPVTPSGKQQPTSQAEQAQENHVEFPLSLSLLLLGLIGMGPSSSPARSARRTGWIDMVHTVNLVIQEAQNASGIYIHDSVIAMGDPAITAAGLPPTIRKAFLFPFMQKRKQRCTTVVVVASAQDKIALGLRHDTTATHASLPQALDAEAAKFDQNARKGAARGRDMA
ncbi:hypothetical protein HU200_048554 [Digitaria exilis]|uniref:Cytochrome P450 n=1 Tax=Digitaria exilis TaxID=1010633 RepID=A0A835B1I5_9POAL|nr:hypothetical protein HU200_048554 [Digitaria exilis]